MTDPEFIIALLGAILGAASIVLHVVAPRTKNTVDDAIRDDIDKILSFMRAQSPQNIAPAPRDKQAGTSFLGCLVALSLGGALAATAVVACSASQARQTVSAGVVTAIKCEFAGLGAQALADVETFATAKVQQWLGGGVAPSAAAIKADLASIKSDLGRCAIAGALAAATAAVAPTSTPGTSVSALTSGAPPAAVRAQFQVAVRELGWAPVLLASGEVL